ESRRVAKKAGQPIMTVTGITPPYRVMSGNARIGSRPVVVQVARDEASIIQDQRQLVYILMLGLPIAVVAAGVGGYVLARRALAPVDSMTWRARLINAPRLKDRLSAGNPA